MRSGPGGWSTALIGLSAMEAPPDLCDCVVNNKLGNNCVWYMCFSIVDEARISICLVDIKNTFPVNCLSTSNFCVN